MIIIQIAGGLGNQLQQYALYQKFKSLGAEAKRLGLFCAQAQSRLYDAFGKASQLQPRSIRSRPQSPAEKAAQDQPRLFDFYIYYFRVVVAAGAVSDLEPSNALQGRRKACLEPGHADSVFRFDLCAIDLPHAQREIPGLPG